MNKQEILDLKNHSWREIINNLRYFRVKINPGNPILTRDGRVRNTWTRMVDKEIDTFLKLDLDLSKFNPFELWWMTRIVRELQRYSDLCYQYKKDHGRITLNKEMFMEVCKETFVKFRELVRGVNSIHNTGDLYLGGEIFKYLFENKKIYKKIETSCPQLANFIKTYFFFNAEEVSYFYSFTKYAGHPVYLYDILWTPNRSGYNFIQFVSHDFVEAVSLIDCIYYLKSGNILSFHNDYTKLNYVGTVIQLVNNQRQLIVNRTEYVIAQRLIEDSNVETAQKYLKSLRGIRMTSEDKINDNLQDMADLKRLLQFQF